MDVGSAAVRAWLEERWEGEYAAMSARDPAEGTATEGTTAEGTATEAMAAGKTAAQPAKAVVVDAAARVSVGASGHVAQHADGDALSPTVNSSASSFVASAPSSFTCPNPTELASAFDLDGDAAISSCEIKFAYQPLAALLRDAGRPRDVRPRQLMPGCAALYRCLAAPAKAADPVKAAAPAEMVAPPSQGGPQEALKKDDDMAAEETVVEEEKEREEEVVGEALCRRGDLGPFPCLEPGCAAHGIAIGCRQLARGTACDKRFSEVWARPQGWAARLRVWEACPRACSLCAEEPGPRRGMPTQNMGSCDA